MLSSTEYVSNFLETGDWRVSSGWDDGTLDGATSQWVSIEDPLSGCNKRKQGTEKFVLNPPKAFDQVSAPEFISINSGYIATNTKNQSQTKAQIKAEAQDHEKRWKRWNVDRRRFRARQKFIGEGVEQMTYYSDVIIHDNVAEWSTMALSLRLMGM